MTEGKNYTFIFSDQRSSEPSYQIQARNLDEFWGKFIDNIDFVKRIFNRSKNESMETFMKQIKENSDLRMKFIHVLSCDKNEYITIYD